MPAAQPHDVPLQFLAGTGILGLLLFAAVVAAAPPPPSARCADPRARSAPRPPRSPSSGRLSPARARRLQLGLPRRHGARRSSPPGRSPPLARPAPAARRQPFAALAVAAVGVACLVSLASPWLAERSVRAGEPRARRRQPRGCGRRGATSSHRSNPLSIEPSLKLAGVETRRGRARAAREAYAQAIRTQPENPDTWYALGSYEFALGDLCNAYVHLNEAYTLDPASRRWTAGGPLDRRARPRQRRRVLR